MIKQKIKDYINIYNQGKIHCNRLYSKRGSLDQEIYQ